MEQFKGPKHLMTKGLSHLRQGNMKGRYAIVIIICDWICKKGSYCIRAIISIKQYNFAIQYILRMISAACTCFSVNLQLFKVIHCVCCTLDSQLNCPPFQIVYVVIHSQLSACQGKMGPLKGHPSTRGHQTGLRKRPE